MNTPKTSDAFGDSISQKLLCGYCNSATYSRSYSKNYFSQKIPLVTHPNRTRKESDGWTRVTPDCSESWVGWPTHRCNFETLQNVTDGLRLCFQKLTLHKKSSKTAMGSTWVCSR